MNSRYSGSDYQGGTLVEGIAQSAQECQVVTVIIAIFVTMVNIYHWNSLTINNINPTTIIIIIVTFIIFQMSCMYEPECKFFTYFKADHFQVLPFLYKKGFWVVTCLLEMYLFTNLAFFNIVQKEGHQTHVKKNTDFVKAFWHEIDKRLP